MTQKRMIRMATGGYADKDGKERKPKTPKTGEPVDNAPFVGYVNVELTDTQKGIYAKWVESASLWEQFNYFVSVGVNMSVKRELGNGGYLASGTQRDPSSPNAGLVVTARGRDPMTAFGRLVYTLTVIDKQGPWHRPKPREDEDRW